MKYTSVLYYILVFFFFLLVHVCGVRKHEFQSEMRNLAEGPSLRLLGILEARISLVHRFSALKMLVITVLLAKSKDSCFLPGDLSRDSESPIQADGMNQMSSCSAKTSLAPQIRTVAPESPAVSLSLVSDNLQKGNTSHFTRRGHFLFYSGHNTFIYAEQKEPQNHRLPGTEETQQPCHM